METTLATKVTEAIEAATTENVTVFIYAFSQDEEGTEYCNSLNNPTLNAKISDSRPVACIHATGELFIHPLATDKEVDEAMTATLG